MRLHQCHWEVLIPEIRGANSPDSLLTHSPTPSLGFLSEPSAGRAVIAAKFQEPLSAGRAVAGSLSRPTGGAHTAGVSARGAGLGRPRPPARWRVWRRRAPWYVLRSFPKGTELPGRLGSALIHLRKSRGENSFENGEYWGGGTSRQMVIQRIDQVFQWHLLQLSGQEREACVCVSV